MSHYITLHYKVRPRSYRSHLQRRPWNLSGIFDRMIWILHLWRFYYSFGWYHSGNAFKCQITTTSGNTNSFDKKNINTRPSLFTSVWKDHFKCQRKSIATEKDGKWPLGFMNISSNCVLMSSYPWYCEKQLLKWRPAENLTGSSFLSAVI